VRGSCLCGAVTFETDARPVHVLACHCTQCRKQSGHHWAAARVPKPALAMAGEVRWFQASPSARRGFCPACGSLLFWEPLDGSGTISFAMGAVDGPTGLALERHIFVADKGDYYAIADGLPQDRGDEP
jgi:hypothetical protein